MIITQFFASIKPNNEFTPKMGRQRFSNPPKVKEYFDESILKSTLAKTIPSLLYSCNRLICLSTNNCKKIGMLQFHRHSKNDRTKEIRGGPACWWTVKNANDLRCMFSLFGGGWQALTTLLLSGDKTVMKRDPHKHNYTQLSFQKSCAVAILSFSNVKY